jgi:hypothetical protein
MKEPLQGSNWFFVDESGDPTFYDRHGNLIVGQAGCSAILILGFIETEDPHSLRNALTALHEQLANDEYLQDIPSMLKTNVAFHAKDDVPEVRQAFYRLLQTLDYKAQFIVARKIERVFRTSFHAREGEFYDYLVSRLFQNALHRYTHNHIYFSQRGSRTRQAPLEQAIRQGVSRFEEKRQKKVATVMDIAPQTAVGEPCLQVIDYMNWAVYQAFIHRQMRYYRFIEEKVSFLVDLYDIAKYPKNWYSHDNPFDITKISPL